MGPHPDFPLLRHLTSNNAKDPELPDNPTQEQIDEYNNQLDEYNKKKVKLQADEEKYHREQLNRDW